MSKKRLTSGENVLLSQTPNDRYRDVIGFCHAMKETYGSAANTAKVAIEKWGVYQDWKDAQQDEIEASRTRSASGQFVSESEQKCRLAR